MFKESKCVWFSNSRPVTLMGLKLSENDRSEVAVIKLGTHGTNKHTLV